ncbi:MAG: hypothetical protein IJO72_03735 [Oscillospiraceae bacterium]|nr:hypothetical protein [Oscillospiraceae bacterium]
MKPVGKMYYNMFFAKNKEILILLGIVLVGDDAYIVPRADVGIRPYIHNKESPGQKVQEIFDV